MIIKSVRMKNFRSHADSEVSFGPGINVILGENGSGKTTVLEAVSFCLFKDYSGGLEKLVRSGQTAMDVSVTFSASGRDYMVVRKRRKASIESRLYELDGGKEKEICSGDARVDDEIGTILGIDRYLFSNAIYVRQGEIESLLTETPFKKKQLVGRLLGIESLEKVWEAMKPVIDVYRQRKAVAEGELSREGEMRQRIESLGREISEISSRMKKTESEMTARQKELSSAEEDEKKLSMSEKRYLELSLRARDLSSALGKEKEALERAKKKHSLALKASEEAGMLREKASPERRKEMEKRLTEATDRLRELDGEAGKLSGRISEMSEFDGRLEKVGGRCPLCGSEITENHRSRMLSERNERMHKMKSGLERLDAERKKAKSLLEGLRAASEELSSSEKRLGELSVLASEKEELGKAVAGGEKETGKLEAELRSAEEELKPLQGTMKAYERAKEKVSGLRSELMALREAFGRQEGSLQRTKESLEQEKESAAALGEKRKLHRRLDDFIGILSEIRSAFDKSGIQLELRRRAVPVIEEHVRDFFREFNFEYSDITLTEDYDIVLHGPGGDATSAMVSGGERVASALALRLGIARTLAGPGAETVMLDEPTIFLDEQRRLDLIEVLKRMDAIPQMIVVTHDPALEDAADSITVIRKEKGISAVSV